MTETDLFGAEVHDGQTVDADGYQKEPKPIRAPDIYSFAAGRMLNIEGWKLWSWDASAKGGLLVEGAVPSGTNRYGGPEWRKNEKGQRVILTNDAIEAARLTWERETGKCVDCGGDGRRAWGWSATRGHKYVPCERCHATGIAPSAVIASSGAAR